MNEHCLKTRVSWSYLYNSLKIYKVNVHFRGLCFSGLLKQSTRLWPHFHNTPWRQSQTKRRKYLRAL